MKARGAVLLVAVLGLAAGTADAQDLVIDGRTFAGWTDYVTSDYFEATGRRCGLPDAETRALLYGPPEAGAPSDCSLTSTNPSPDYDSTVVYEIPVVVHILHRTNGTGNLSDQLVQSQIDVLNEDFQALLGTPGAAGADVAIRFVLADEDPNGSPTTGITRTANNTWYSDSGSYWSTLAWDPDRYLNIYTNTAGGALGYVPFLPMDGGGSWVGSSSDRVVVNWQAFGRPGPGGPPYGEGRTATHEVGHYLGLLHVFQGGCATGSSPACYANGDLVCDTNPIQFPTGGCPASSNSCGSPDPFDNYMDYSFDTCMTRFTPEQARRMRCALEHYRPNLYRVVQASLFEDGFESGDATLWSSVVQ